MIKGCGVDDVCPAVLWLLCSYTVGFVVTADWTCRAGRREWV